MSNQTGNTAEQSASTSTPPPAKGSAFGRPYWMLNSIEMFERLAYFGIRAVVPLYIMQATEPGGLHLTAIHKGWIYMWWAILQSWLPMFTGGIADRYGYKKVLFFAISANVVGYLMMAAFHDYYGFFAGILVLATGTAFFKPALQGSIAQNLTKENSSLGWGIFYWVVNIGAVLAPILATIILGKPHSAEGWRNLFIASAIFTAMNLLLLLTFRDVPSGADKTESLVKVFGRTVENIWPYWFVGGRLHPLRGPLGILLVVVGLFVFILYTEVAKWLNLTEQAGMLSGAGLGVFVLGGLLATWLQGGTFQWQLRLPAFLLIMSCFWMMMYQLWDLHPNFITDWINSDQIADYAPAAWREYGDRGLIQVPQQILLNLNAALIVALIVPISWAARKMRTLSAMLVGMSVATLGVLVAGLTQSGWILLLGIVFFSLGEMWTGPKKNEYLGLIAPPGKKGLYLGYVNIPVGVGVGLGSMIAGIVYDNYGEKATLALKELAARPALIGEAARSIDWSDSLDRIPTMLGIERGEALALAAAEMKVDPSVAGETLRAQYQYDRGQIVNLAYLYLAQNVPTAIESVQPKLDRGGAIPAGELAAHIGDLPKWTHVSRVEVLDVVREFINQEREVDRKLYDRAIVELLWETYGTEPEVLNNLALEYLAQATDRLATAVAQIEIENPVEDIPEKVGIGRTKSFFALSAAEGASAVEVERELLELDTAATDERDRLYVYLAQLPHVRFIAVAQRNWSHDVTLLEEMIDDDADAKAIAEDRIDEQGFIDVIVATVSGWFGGTQEQTFYERLAGNQDLIQDALAAKDWTRNADHARWLLRMSVPEAQARASVELKNNSLATTNLLWDKYHPQYMVWIPFASIGILATIALAVFGQMAKRWKDMNA